MAQLSRLAPEAAARRCRRLDQLAADLQSVLDCSDRGSKLVKQLVAFSRGQTLRRRVLNLNPLLENASGLVEHLITAEIELLLCPTPRIGNVDADAGQIEQVLMNLCVNARDAMPRGGRLTLATDTVLLDAAGARRLGVDHAARPSASTYPSSTAARWPGSKLKKNHRTAAAGPKPCCSSKMKTWSARSPCVSWKATATRS